MSSLSLVTFHLMISFFSFWRKQMGNSVFNSVSLSTALIFLRFFFLRKPLFKISKMKKNYSFQCPTFAKMKKKSFKYSRAQNGVVPETMQGMSRCPRLVPDSNTQCSQPSKCQLPRLQPGEIANFHFQFFFFFYKEEKTDFHERKTCIISIIKIENYKKY